MLVAERQFPLALNILTDNKRSSMSSKNTYTEQKYCVYITYYSGDKMPKNYIGSSSVNRIINGYKGSVVSKNYRSVWKSELKENPHLFSTKIISYHDTRPEALWKELHLQKIFNVVKNPLFINMSYASPNGYFGAETVRTKEEIDQFRNSTISRNKEWIDKGVHPWQLEHNRKKVSLRNSIINKEKVKNNQHNFQTISHKLNVSNRNSVLSTRELYIEVRDLFKQLKLSCPTGLNLKSNEFLEQKKLELLSGTYIKEIEQNSIINAIKTSNRNNKLSSRVIYLEVRDLYKLLKLPIPKGLNLKSDKFLYEKKEELLH